MKINVATGPFLSLPPAPCGAVERIWFDLAAVFSMQHETRVYGRRHPTLKTCVTSGRLEVNNYGPAFHGSSSLMRNLIKDAVYSLDVIRRMRPCDLLIVNSFWMPALAPLFRRKFARVAYNVARMPKYQFKLYSGIDRFYAVSSAVKHELNSQCPSAADRAVVIGNPINTNVFRQRNLPKSNTILYAGRIHPEKGIHVLLDAFRIFSELYPDWKLKIVGPHRLEDLGGGESYMKDMQRTAVNMPVEFAPAIYDRELLAQEYQRARLFCYPSLAETGESFGVSPLEAMATGLLPIVSDLSCFKDFLHAGINGEVFDHRCSSPAVALAEKMKALIGNPDLGAMQVAAMTAAHSYSCEAIADRYMDDFDVLCRSN